MEFIAGAVLGFIIGVFLTVGAISDIEIARANGRRWVVAGKIYKAIEVTERE